MEQQNYKENIRETRTGNLGSSDGALLQQIATLGYVPKSAYKRMAVCKGLIEQEEIPQTSAIRAGDELEMLVYEHLSFVDDRYISNPLWISRRYSKKNVRLISHPDLVLEDYDKKELKIYECKCTKFDIERTLDTYSGQLYIHSELGNERAKQIGRGWKVKLFLVHYDTNGLDLDNNGIEFDVKRLTVVPVSVKDFKLNDAMNIVNDFLSTFDSYVEEEEVPFEYLPTNVQQQLLTIANVLGEIQEREKQVDDFKKKLYSYLSQKGVKSIKSDLFNITCVAPTESVSFDSKAFLQDLKDKHPRVYQKTVRTFEKRIKRNGYCTIKLKNNKNNV